MIEHLLDTDGLMKPATPKSNNNENNVKYKRQETMLRATPPLIKQVSQPDSSEQVKPKKQLKRSIETEETEKDISERIPVKENKEKKINEANTFKTAQKKFQQKIKIQNATELFKKFPTKEDVNNEYLKEHFKNFEISASKMNKTVKYIVLAASNIHCSIK